MRGLANQIRTFIIRPVLLNLNPIVPYSETAEDILLGTCAQESHLGGAIDQLPRSGEDRPGPAYGPFQQELGDLKDIENNYLVYHPALSEKLRKFHIPVFEGAIDELHGNWYLAAAFCRIHYYRVPESLPWHGDVNAYAAYWKKYYNSIKGAGTEQEFIENWQRLVAA